MKGKSKRLQVNHGVGSYGKVDRVVQKSFSREEKHLLRTVNGGFWNNVMLIFSKLFRFFFNNESLEGVRHFGPVLPHEVTENNSGKKWYKTHLPKSMRKGKTNREKTTVRQSIYRKHIKFV